ncbi:MAG: AMP-binding protein [Burkholderiaceae bacterium]
MNSTPSWTPVTALYHWEKTRPDEVFLTQPKGGEAIDYTWAQVGDQVRRMAQHLSSLGFPPGSRIAIMSKNCAHWIMAELAILMAGHVSVPIYPSVNAETLRYILDHSESALMFLGGMEDWAETRAGVPDRLPIITLPGAPSFDPPRENVLPWDDLVAVTPPMQGEVPPRKADDLALIIYTSGSTGQPKGVMIGFGAMEFAANTSDQLVSETKPGDRVLSYLPLAHAYEHAGILSAGLRYGLHIYFNESLATFQEDLRRARPMSFLSVPRLWVKFQLGILQRLPQEKLDALLADPATAAPTRRQLLEQLGLQDARFAVTGSAPLPAAVLEWYHKLGLELLEGYGMTEDFAYSHLSFPGKTRVGYVGSALNGVERRISESGEILVRSPAQMLGYYKQPELTKESFTEDGFFKTGDMGEIDEEGRLKITGRVKELFKTSKGKYVAPAPIENVLGSHPGVEVALVMGSGQPAAFGMVMLSAEALQAAQRAEVRNEIMRGLEELLQSINAKLQAHERLEFVAVANEQWTIANGFLTPTMKIRRNIIEKHYEPMFDTWFAARKPVVWAEA